MNKRLYSLLIAFILFPFLFFAGCGMRASLISQLSSDNDWPKKTVVVMPVTNISGIDINESKDAISKKFTNMLRKTASFHLYPQNKTKKLHSLKPGEKIDTESMREARDIGINAIIFETLNPIEVTPAKSGIWPFRKRAWRCTVSMNIDILDVNTGTILLSKEVADSITLSGEEITEETTKDAHVKIKKMALKKCLPDIIKEVVVATGLSLNQQPWTGRIISIDTKEIIINAGSGIGLRPGVVLEVFSKGEYVTSFNKQTYQLPGPKAGEIKIVSIQQYHSFAEPIKEGNFKPGQILRVKD